MRRAAALRRYPASVRRSAPFIILAVILAGVGLLTVVPRVHRSLQKRAAVAPGGAQPTVGPTTLFPALGGDELRKALREYAAAGHDPLSYRRAREIVYWQLDNEADHVVTIYERRRLELDPGAWPDPELIRNS